MREFLSSVFSIFQETGRLKKMDPPTNTKTPATIVTETEIKDTADPLAVLKSVINNCIHFPSKAELMCGLAWKNAACAWDKDQTILELTHLAKVDWSNATRHWAPEDERRFNSDWVVLCWIFHKQDDKVTEPPAWAMRANAILMKKVPGRTVVRVIQEILTILS